MRGALQGSESICQPGRKCTWKSQPSLGSLPRVIQTLPLQVFGAEQHLLMFSAMKTPCVHAVRFPSLSAHVLLLAFTGLGQNSLLFIAGSVIAKWWGRRGGGVGSHRGHLPGDTVKLACCLGNRRQPRCTVCTGNMVSQFCGHAEAIYFYLSKLNVPKTAGWSSRRQVISRSSTICHGSKFHSALKQAFLSGEKECVVFFFIHWTK